jgi:hypothetical protein
MRAKKKSPYHKDILGQRFGKLTVLPTPAIIGTGVGDGFASAIAGPKR